MHVVVVDFFGDFLVNIPIYGGRLGCDRMLLGSTYAISAYHH